MIIPEDTFTTVYCKICGKGMKTLGPHFKSHGITARDYQQMFPGAPTYSEEERLKACERAEKSNAKFKGQKRDPAIGEKIKSTKKANPKPNGWLGRKHSEETKQKQSTKKKELFASGEIVHWNTGNTTSEETKQKISEGTKGYKFTEEQYKRWEEAMIELRSDPNYVAPMQGKEHSSKTRAKLSISAKRNAARQFKQSTQRVTLHLSQFNINVVLREKNLYSLECGNCNTIFTRTAGVLTPQRYEFYNGEYCPTCYPSETKLYWSPLIFKNNPEIKDIYGELYLIKLYNDEEEFIKIGITSKSTIIRWSNFKTYNIEIICYFSMTIFKAYCLEQLTLKKYKHYKYQPNLSFGGQSECLNKDCLSEVLKFIKENQQEEIISSC
jgi:hypothetical protein